MKEFFSNKNGFAELMRENSRWLFAMIAAIPICLTAFLKFIEYVHAISYAIYYAVDIEFYNFASKSYMYSLLLSIIFMIPVFLSVYAVYRIRKTGKILLILKNNIFDIVVSLVTNTVVGFLSIKSFDVVMLIIVVILMYFIEYICVKIITKEVDTGNVNNNIYMIFGLVFLFAVLLCFKTFFEEISRKDYRIIGDNKVVIYTDNDYYLTLDCAISDDNVLTIYTGTQTKIDNTDVYTTYRKFKSTQIINTKE